MRFARLLPGEKLAPQATDEGLVDTSSVKNQRFLPPFRLRFPVCALPPMRLRCTQTAAHTALALDSATGSGQARGL